MDTRQKRADTKQRKIQQAHAKAHEWRDENDEVVAWLERNRYVGGQRPDQRYWNDFAYERVMDYRWAMYGDDSPLTERWLTSIKQQMEKQATRRPTALPQEAWRVNEETRVGRMLTGMLASDRPSAKVVVTVELTGQEQSRLHQTFDLKKWRTPDERTLIFVSLHGSGDYGQGIMPTRVLTVVPGEGSMIPHRDMQRSGQAANEQKLLVYAARKAVEYAFKGEVAQPGNGTIKAEEASYCGRCGRELTHPDSIALGIGPECRGWENQGETIKEFFNKKAAAKAEGGAA